MDKFVNEISEANLQPVLGGPLSEIPPVIENAGWAGVHRRLFTATTRPPMKPAFGGHDRPGASILVSTDLRWFPASSTQLAFRRRRRLSDLHHRRRRKPRYHRWPSRRKKSRFSSWRSRQSRSRKGTDIHVLFRPKGRYLCFPDYLRCPGAVSSISITRIDDENGEEENF